MQKSKLRPYLIRQRNQFAGQHLHATICTNAKPFLEFAHTIGIYSAIKNEVDPKYLQILLPDKQYFLPKISESTLKFGNVDEHLIPNQFGILEPQKANFDIHNLDCIIVPLVGFDNFLHRIGFGMGFYDRALANYTGVKLGLAYAWQEVTHISSQPHDIKLDFVVTENEVLRR